jgi:hypothetical protein
MRLRPSSRICFPAVALAAALLTQPATVHGAGADYSGRYECTDVLEGADAVSMTFALSVVSHRGEEIAGATVRLLDASDPGIVYAQFPALGLSPGIDVSLSASIVLEPAEWERWKRGAPPRVHLEAFDVDGTDVSAMVDLVRVSSPEVLQ